jgi:TM2 domain-containing membrane protein YozV
MNGSEESRTQLTDTARPTVRPPEVPPAQSSGWRRNAFAYDDPRHKSPALAAILSSMPGLGQIYIGYYQQGFINIVVVGSIIVALTATSRLISNLQPLLGLFLAFFWLYNVVDAYRRAHFYNHALEGLGPVEIPEDMKLPKGGSFAGGIALIVVGLVLFGNTALGMSLDWVEQWWPMGLVLLGAYLIYGHFSAGRRSVQAPARSENEPTVR